MNCRLFVKYRDLLRTESRLNATEPATAPNATPDPAVELQDRSDLHRRGKRLMPLMRVVRTVIFRLRRSVLGRNSGQDIQRNAVLQFSRHQANCSQSFLVNDIAALQVRRFISEKHRYRVSVHASQHSRSEFGDLGTRSGFTEYQRNVALVEFEFGCRRQA